VPALGEPARDTTDDPEGEQALMAEYMEAHDLTWTVAFSDDSVFSPDYGVRGIPFVVIVDRQGVVRQAGVNPGEESLEQLEGWVRAALDG
jgi:hypothetical protein